MRALSVGVCVWVLAAGARSASADQAKGGGVPGRVFPLEVQPLPVDGSLTYLARKTLELQPVETRPLGVEGADMMGSAILLGRDADARYEVVATRSGTHGRFWDRLYVDADGNGRLVASECFDLTRSGGLVRSESIIPGRIWTEVHAVKLTPRPGTSRSPCWVTLRVYQSGKYGLRAAVSDITWAHGRVTLGGRTVRLGIWGNLTGRFDRRVELPKSVAPDGEAPPIIPEACQLLLDIDGNGRFDDLRPFYVRPEHRWLTRLIRFEGAYYDVKVAADGRSVRITPSTARVGTLALPADVESATLTGPEFAVFVTNQDQRAELPAGRYSVDACIYRTNGVKVWVGGRTPDGVIDVKPDHADPLRVGPPFEMRVTCEPARPTDALVSVPGSPGHEMSISLSLFDGAGRRVRGLQDAYGKRPPPPRFKIVDQAGKTVLNESFEYG